MNDDGRPAGLPPRDARDAGQAPPERPRYGSLVAACLLGLAVAAAAGFAGLLTGGGFATAPESPPAALAGWGIAGVALGAPIAGLPRFGIPVPWPAAVAVGVGVAVIVAVVGYQYTVRGTDVLP